LYHAQGSDVAHGSNLRYSPIMSTIAPPQDQRRPRRQPRPNARNGDQPDNEGGFSQWFIETNAGAQFNKETQRYDSGPFKGKTLPEAQTLGRDMFTALNKSNPGFADQWGSRARGEDVSTGPKAMGQLPENMRGIPNAPDLSGFQQFDKQGRQVAGPSPSARQRFMDGVAQAAGRKAEAKQAVQDRIKWQKENPGAVADMSIAARDAQLAESGITDLGGGTKAMTNKYGTGFATKMTPQEAADRKAGKTAGTIMDEKGVVDVKGMMANKGVGTTTPYQPGSTETPSLNLDARDANRSNIQSSIAAAIPGADERRAADRRKTVNAISVQNASTVVAREVAGFDPIPTWDPVRAAVEGPVTNVAGQAGVEAGNAALSGAGMKPRAVFSPVAVQPLGTVSQPRRASTEAALPKTLQGLPDDRPGQAFQTARKLAFPFAVSAVNQSQTANTSSLPSRLPFGGPTAQAPQAAVRVPMLPTSTAAAVNPNYSGTPRAAMAGATRTKTQATPSPQIEAIKTGVKAVPSNIVNSLTRSWDGMKRTLIGA
jgi:hypothetical protein